MASSAPPTEYFPGINFNLSFYTVGDSSVSLNYVNSNFLRCNGYTYSRSIDTTFNGSLYCLGGINITNITATGTITSNLFSGSGAGLSNLNASNISTGTLAVSRGGTGQNVTYESNILSAGKFADSGAELTNLNATRLCARSGLSGN
jgi:hypothetical protein